MKFLYLLIGLGLLTLVLSEIDIADVSERVILVGWGLAVIFGLYLIAFTIDSFTWQMALVEVPLNGVWMYRTWKIRMVGEVFNTVMPAAGMGGEPVKAVLLKKYYGIGYRAGTASLILGKTINMVSLVIFLVGGFVLIWRAPELPTSYKFVAGLGLLALGAGVGLFFIIQRLKITSVAGSRISRWRIGAWVDGVVHHIHDMDERLVYFYTQHERRFAGAVMLALINWLLGVAEIYYSMLFLGHPVSVADAWIIEAAAQLVRAGAFFIPAGIGVQEGVFFVVCSAMTGIPALGAAVAVVRRIREALWLAWGTLLGFMFTLMPEHDAGKNPQSEA